MFAIIAIPTPAQSINPSPIADAQRLAYQQAKAAAKQNNAALVEETLAAVITAPRNSAAWHTRLGQQLLSVVFDVPREARCDILSQLTALARSHYEAAFAQASNPIEKAAIKVQLGKLHERYTGDRTAALASYKEAFALNPRDSYAQHAAERLERTQQILQERRMR